ncbi:Protein-tyrosine phosphatase [Teladorsagia circumcincta]|uniref:Protein-tyrosine phosphatase n=1 Tax=Teladorsagia circumcincta TaxID=45464 RepID=A0A2G9UGS8_TELCI|nr:Protein-tyrosine phosphatase [Teladorsagia circumcincta]
MILTEYMCNAEMNSLWKNDEVLSGIPDRSFLGVKCRDSSRVTIRYPSDGNDDFIHANYVCGGPLFNKFILTQAPMENTIGDFWRMVWQEKPSYIFMLIGRKDKDRCAEYWPRRPDSNSIDVHGLHIHNVGISCARDPVFRVTYIRILNDFGEEVRDGCGRRLV